LTPPASEVEINPPAPLEIVFVDPAMEDIPATAIDPPASAMGATPPEPARFDFPGRPCSPSPHPKKSAHAVNPHTKKACFGSMFDFLPCYFFMRVRMNTPRIHLKTSVSLIEKRSKEKKKKATLSYKMAVLS